VVIKEMMVGHGIADENGAGLPAVTTVLQHQDNQLSHRLRLQNPPYPSHTRLSEIIPLYALAKPI